MQRFINFPVINIIKSTLPEINTWLKRDFNEIGYLKLKQKREDFVFNSQKHAFRRLRTALERSNSNHGFILNDVVEKESENGFSWVVKPIDNTLNFMHTLPFWGVMIMLMNGNECSFCVYYMPMQDDLFLAIENQGAYFNGKKLKALPIKVNLVCGDSKKCNFNIGSAFLHISYLCAGKFDALVQENFTKHEKAFAKLMINEAGMIFNEEKQYGIAPTFEEIVLHKYFK